MSEIFNVELDYEYLTPNEIFIWSLKSHLSVSPYIKNGQACIYIPNYCIANFVWAIFPPSVL